MLISRSDLGRRKPGFAWWRMFAWVLLLLAAYGGVEYIQHAQQVWSALQTLPAGDSHDHDASILHGMLGWDIGYLAASFVVIVACAGCILRHAWARPVLRTVALLLCVYFAYCALQLWTQFSKFNAILQATGQFPGGQIAELVYLRKISMIELGLAVVAVPLLLWLAWQLGHPAVRLQFRARRA
jgi:hypothetical protein